LFVNIFSHAFSKKKLVFGSLFLIKVATFDMFMNMFSPFLVAYGSLFFTFFTITIFDICDLLSFIMCSFVNFIVSDEYLNPLPIPYVTANM